MNSCKNRRDVEKAFDENDIEASQFHHNKVEDYHKIPGSDLLKSIIYGGLDGIITTFAIIISSYAGNLDMKTIISLGFGNMLADGISMGHGDYFSEKTELDFVKDQYKREKWEMENYPEGEMREMKELYKKNYNVNEIDCDTILDTMAKNKKLFVDHMMMIELGLLPPDDSNPIYNGIATFISFIFFGCFPLISFIVSNNIYVSSGITFLTLCILGYIRSFFTHTNCFLSMFYTALNGVMSGSCAYLVVWGIESIH